MSNSVTGRRPLKSRDTTWAHLGARTLKSWGFTPNFISVLSIGFSFLSFLSFLKSHHSPQGLTSALWLIAAALMIQCRLLCNLFDGMVAIEFQQKSKSGDIYNEAPDRLADLFIILGAGFAVRTFSWATELAWAASCLAILTAYIRVLGMSAGTKTYFLGPMAKPHRMAILTGACLVAAGINGFQPARQTHGHLTTDWIFMIILGLIAVGSLVTILRRLQAIVSELER